MLLLQSSKQINDCFSKFENWLRKWKSRKQVLNKQGIFYRVRFSEDPLKRTMKPIIFNRTKFSRYCNSLLWKTSKEINTHMVVHHHLFVLVNSSLLPIIRLHSKCLWHEILIDIMKDNAIFYWPGKINLFHREQRAFILVEPIHEKLSLTAHNDYIHYK